MRKLLNQLLSCANSGGSGFVQGNGIWSVDREGVCHAWTWVRARAGLRASWMEKLGGYECAGVGNVGLMGEYRSVKTGSGVLVVYRV